MTPSMALLKDMVVHKATHVFFYAFGATHGGQNWCLKRSGPPRLDVESIRENLDCGVHNLWEPCKEVQPGYMNETYQRLLTSRIQKDAFVSILRRPERVFAVVSHYGTIESLIRRRTSNGMMFCVHLKLSNNENSGHDGWEVLSVEEMRRGQSSSIAHASLSLTK